MYIGPNRTSGGYDIQIPGGVSSGDLIGGEEWIFVPIGTNVSYSIDSSDVQQYLDENPDIDPANATMNYSIASIEYGDNSQRIELPDGNWTVTDRIVSISIEDIIEPNKTKEVNITLPDVRYINGTVIDNITGSGITGATISINGGNSTVSDSLGFYSLPVVEGEYNLTAKLEPVYYQNNSVAVSTVGVAVAVQDIELAKKPTGTIIGSVRN